MVSLVKLARPYQWSKNLLCFVPVVVAHQSATTPLISRLVLGFLALCVVASAGYIVNDLRDRASDRAHPTKRFRPVAAGDVSPIAGGALALFLAVAGYATAFAVSADFFVYLIGYGIVTVVYSFWLKRVVLADCLVLSGLYVLRILAGAAVVNVPVSYWLLTFALFFFTSLAFSKRYSEIVARSASLVDGALAGRAYSVGDGPLVLSLGVAAGFVSLLVLSLYLQSDVVRVLYGHPERLWFALPLMAYWIARLWLTAHRGRLAEDPVLFALRDKGSLVTGALVVIVFVMSLNVAPF
jgi:4-hydroxybenzoate polyprenyltransferase